MQPRSQLAQHVPEPWRDPDRFEVTQDYHEAIQSARRKEAEELDFLERYAASPPMSQAASDTSATQSPHTAAPSTSSTATVTGQQQSAANVLPPRCDSSAVSWAQPTTAAGAPSDAIVHIASLDEWVNLAHDWSAFSHGLQGEPAALRLSGCPLYI